MRGRRGGKLLDKYFPGWRLHDLDGIGYVQFEDLGRNHLVKVHENSSGKYIKYMGDRYYLGGKYV